MTAHPLNYFQTAAEADEWLCFDEDVEVVEHRAFKEPDRHAEWQRWRRFWVAAGEPVDKHGIPV